MAQRRNGAPQGVKDNTSPAKDVSEYFALNTIEKNILIYCAAQDKQVRLLSQDAGHFSLIRALHLADFITELNGTAYPSPYMRWGRNADLHMLNRFLWCYVRLLLAPLLHPR